MLYTDAFLAAMEAALRSALPCWGVPETAALRLLNISENATWLAGAAPGGLVVRVHRPGYNSDAAIASELLWMGALRAAGVAETPVHIAARDGRAIVPLACRGLQLRAVGFAFIAGTAPDEGCDRTLWYGRLGEITARLHAHARDWVRPEGFTRRTWDFEAICGPRADWGDWRAGIGLDAAGRAVLEAVETGLAAACDGCGRGPARFGLIHGDMRAANLLVDGDRLAVIDFDDCGFGWLLYDFAAATSFMDAETVRVLQPHWVAGYRRVAPLPAEDEALLPMFVLLRRLQLVGWIASHADAPEPQALGAGFTAATVAEGRRWLEGRP
ncbi:phosphotransferase [Pseudoxanthobacter sp.]|uniref:phosphotransferase enzyme family protein n=1 Tax=Pseudoxanthobacter sp. TaxID=1925742 RepID=UPI002FE08C5A